MDLNDIFAGSNQPLAPSGQAPAGDKYQVLGNFYSGAPVNGNPAFQPNFGGMQANNGFGQQYQTSPAFNNQGF